MNAASTAPESAPARPRHLRVAEPAPEEPRGMAAFVGFLVLLVAVSAFAAWEEWRIDDRDDRIASVQAEVTARDATIAGLEDQLAASTNTVAGMRERVTRLEGRVNDAVERIGTVTARRDVLAGNLIAMREELAAARADLEAARLEAAAAERTLVRLTGPVLADGRYVGVVNYVSTVGSQIGRPWTIGFVGIGERALVEGQGVMRVLRVARDAMVRFRSAIPDPPAMYGFVEFEELFYSTSSSYAAVHSWNTAYVITLDEGRVVGIKSIR